MVFIENFFFLRLFYFIVDCCDDVCKRKKRDVVDGDDQEEFYDEELKNQIKFYELFEGLVLVEESVVLEVVVDGDLMRYQE